MVLKKQKKIPGVVQVSIVYDVGERIGVIKSSNDRAGFVIAHGINADEAAETAENGLNRIMITVEEG